jgi:hypothetical protein
VHSLTPQYYRAFCTLQIRDGRTPSSPPTGSTPTTLDLVILLLVRARVLPVRIVARKPAQDSRPSLTLSHALRSSGMWTTLLYAGRKTTVAGNAGAGGTMTLHTLRPAAGTSLRRLAAHSPLHLPRTLGMTSLPQPIARAKPVHPEVSPGLPTRASGLPSLPRPLRVRANHSPMRHLRPRAKLCEILAVLVIPV